MRHVLDDVIDPQGNSLLHPQTLSTTTPNTVDIASLYYGMRVFSLTCMAIGDDPTVDTKWKTDGCDVSVGIPA